LIAQAAPNKLPKRFFGKDRFETSMSIATELSQGQQVNNVILASAHSFPDALAASKGWPILLSGTNSLPESVQDFLSSDQPTQIYVANGLDFANAFKLFKNLMMHPEKLELPMGLKLL